MLLHGRLFSLSAALLSQLTALAAGLAPQDGMISRQLYGEGYLAALQSPKTTSGAAALAWGSQEIQSADTMTVAAGNALQLHQQLLQQLMHQQAELLQEQQRLSAREDALLVDTAALAASSTLAASSSPWPLDATSAFIFLPPIILAIAMVYAVFSMKPSMQREGVFWKSPERESYMTPENVFSRWFAVLSGTLTITAGNCIGSLSFLSGDGTGNWQSALAYTIIMIGAMAVLGVFFFQHKKSLDAASKNETKGGLLDLTPSELLSLTVDEGIISLTAAMSMIVAQVWYKLMPSSIFIVFAGGCVIVIAGELWQRSLEKGTMAEFLVQGLNALNVGSVAWFVGLGLSNHEQNYFGAPNGSSPKVAYWMWLLAFLNAIAVVELINFFTIKFSKRDEKGNRYGVSFYRMLQGVAMYSSAWILNNVVKDRFANYYLIGTFLWVTLSSVAVVAADQVAHLPDTAFAPGAFYADAKDIYMLANNLSSLFGQYLSFICGQVASFALAQYLPSESDLKWCLLAAIFQALALFIEGARTKVLPALFRTPVSHRLSFFASDRKATDEVQRQKAACCC